MSDESPRNFKLSVSDHAVVVVGVVALGLALLWMIARLGSASADCVARCTAAGHAPGACRQACEDGDG